MFDLGPAADDLARIVDGVRDDQLDAPTPCEEWTLGGLLAHIHQFATVFTANASKSPPAPGDGLPDDWRHVIPSRLGDLAQAWRDPSAWEGRVSAGGVEMSGEENAVVAIEELVVHAWDVARATGQDLDVTPETLDHVERFLEIFAGPLASGQGPYGPAVGTDEDASRLDRYLGAAGRDPAWSPTR
ncbi:MAG: TIGR03086 family metal-binding protein [Nocardioidaceae bacterium]